jgi:hypothetical protein
MAVLVRGYTYQADTNTAWQLAPLPRPLNDLPLLVDKLAAAASVPATA